MALFGSAAPSNTQSAVGDLSKDVEVKEIQDDSISSLAFSPTAELLAAGSWNKEVRVWEIDANGNSLPKSMYKHEGPVLSVAWSRDGTKIFSAGADKAARVLDLNQPSSGAQQVAAHDATIKSVQCCEVNGQPVIVTGSWDKKIKYWDLRSATPAASLDCQDRVYAMHSRDKLLVVGTAERWINVVNLNEPQKWYKSIQSPLKWQTRTVQCFSDATGFAVGSIEGRCAIQYVEDKDHSANFSFKCHRQNLPNSSNSNVYSVNAISFHPVHGTFSTAGSDGTFHFWDKDAKHRLKGYPETGQTIISTDFNRSGNIFAYACSYDWSKGFSHHNPQSTSKIMLHPVQGDECKPRKAPGKR